ncbi:hypothetical protein C0585_05625 [Candidatus Woesearchaeota archaeon]|nr:MAG: hypothetical protein C0585_05625 [Candidatus Woesearchaeota archaeon]
MGMFDQILTILGYVNLAAWILAAIASYKFRTIFKEHAKSWTLIMVGSIFVVGRQVIKLLPFYATDIGYIARYVVGGIGALILFIGFLNLYMEAKRI